MLVLDTNVLSELMLPAPNPIVVGWFLRQDQAQLFTSAVNVYELEFGIQRLPAGKRREQMLKDLSEMLANDLGGRVLAFDYVAARLAGVIRAARVKRGVNYDERDAMIAAVALAYSGTVVTRNVVHFDDLQLNLINPWTTDASA